MCVTSEMTLSYGMRVGPMTPMTPVSAPAWYCAVTTVKLSSFGSRCSFPMVIVTPAVSLRRRSSSARCSRVSVSATSFRMLSTLANSGCSARSDAWPKQNGVVVAVERAIEKLLAFFDEDVQQLCRIPASVPCRAAGRRATRGPREA